MPTRGFSVRLCFPDGDPQGVKLVERSNWTGQGIGFPRLQLASARVRPELKRTGVYVLINHDDFQEKPRIYVGQSDDVISRLLEHNSSKDFWSEAVAFTSKDDAFNTSLARFLESELIRIAKERGRANLENSKSPAPPPISEADQADAYRFLEDLLICIQVLGVSAFRSNPRPSEDEPSEDELFYLTARGVNARARIIDGQFVVLAGSLARKDPTPAFLSRPDFKGEVAWRNGLIDAGTFVDDGNMFRVTRDFRYGTPSRPTCALLGAAPDPYVQWKTKDGRTLHEVLRGKDDE